VGRGNGGDTRGRGGLSLESREDTREGKRQKVSGHTKHGLKMVGGQTRVAKYSRSCRGLCTCGVAQNTTGDKGNPKAHHRLCTVAMWQHDKGWPNPAAITWPDESCKNSQHVLFQAGTMKYVGQGVWEDPSSNEYSKTKTWSVPVRNQQDFMEGKSAACGGSG